ncbi:hypothetical protein OH76DRAFT_1397607 [Lentinus brumalis]|uniref:Uncharacterized protein n=1 Tax=Lentinus brumalis TaxID=2498619 RepID=A0A371DRR4_9APHY|nr:hypothetical protein OH76DRAFT_1397607 [Polyporus brumalis]
MCGYGTRGLAAEELRYAHSCEHAFCSHSPRHFRHLCAQLSSWAQAASWAAWRVAWGSVSVLMSMTPSGLPEGNVPAMRFSQARTAIGCPVLRGLYQSHVADWVFAFVVCCLLYSFRFVVYNLA